MGAPLLPDFWEKWRFWLRVGKALANSINFVFGVNGAPPITHGSKVACDPAHIAHLPKMPEFS